MIFKIAFRNIWRNKLRSWAVIGAIALGIFGGLAVVGTAKGLAKMRKDKAIAAYVSHIQIHDSNYVRTGNPNYDIINIASIKNELHTSSIVKAFSPRQKKEAYIQSAGGAGGVILNGVEAENEKKTTNISEQCEEGEFLDETNLDWHIVLGKKTAKNLGVSLGEVVQCSFIDEEGNTITQAFEIIGLYVSPNGMQEEMNAYLHFDKLAELTGTQQIHEIAIQLNNESSTRAMVNKLEAKYPTKLQIDPWQLTAPELGYADKMMDFMMSLFLIIIMLALAFGIVNTMLMAVLERKKELGMLLCVGMNKRKVFWMIVLESVMLSAIAAPIGLLLTYLVITYYKSVGIDLSIASEGLKSVGISSVLYPFLETKYYVQISILVVITGITACIYPAFKALKLNPAETIRTA